MPTYEAAVYNRRVRDALRRGDKNDTGLDDEWENTRYVEVTAPDPEQAAARIERRYPEKHGFVLASLKETS